MPEESVKRQFTPKWLGWAMPGAGWLRRWLRKIFVGIVTLALLPLLWAFVADYIKPRFVALLSVDKVTILMPVQGVARPRDGGTEQYEDKISNDIVQTLINAKLAFQNTHGVNTHDESIVFMTYVEGRNAEERLRIAREQIAQAAADKRPVVAVIGHTTSQATVDAASAYAENGISVLIPYATKTGIAEEVTRPLPNGKHVPRALAFPASNKSQAKSIGDFLKARSVRSVVIFRDAANRAYSDDCGNELVKVLENDTTAENKPPIEIVADIAVGGDIGRWYYTREVAAAKADAYVIITMAKPSLEIVRQIVRTSPTAWPKLIVLTDGAIDDYLVPRIAPTLQTRVSVEDIRPSSEKSVSFPPVYIFFPENAVQPKGYDAIFKKGNGVRGLSHSAYLSDAIFVAYAVALDTVGGARRGNAATVFARKLDGYINYSEQTGAALSGAKLVSADRDYTFLPTGSRAADAAYTVFQLDPSTVGNPAMQGYRIPLDNANADTAR